MQYYSSQLQGEIGVSLWSPAEALDEPLPLVVVHDGTDYKNRGRFIDFAESRADFRVALLDPEFEQRTNWYGGAEQYIDVLASDLLPAIKERLNTGDAPTIGIGGSLGGLSMAGCAILRPGSLDALVLQAASFHNERFYSSGFGYPEYPQIAAMVERICGSSPHDMQKMPILLTCNEQRNEHGELEENNLQGNEAMANVFAAQGHDVSKIFGGGTHDYEHWGELLRWHLPEFLQKVKHTSQVSGKAA